MTVQLRQLGELEQLLGSLPETDTQIIIERDGEPVAVIIAPESAEAMTLLAEEIEERIDVQALEAAEEFNRACGLPDLTLEEYAKSRDHEWPIR